MIGDAGGPPAGGADPASSAPPTTPGEIGHTPIHTSWPVVIGVFSVTLGVIALVAHGVRMATWGEILDDWGVSQIVSGHPWFQIMKLVQLGGAVLASGLLVAAGLWVARRRRRGVRWMWSWVGAHVVIGLAGLALFELMPPDAPWASGLGRGLILQFGWLVSWPLVLWLWLRRESVLAEVRTWKA